MVFVFFNSVLSPFQDYFSSYETGQSVGGRKRENPENLAHPQAELGLSHMWPGVGLERLVCFLINLEVKKGLSKLRAPNNVL